MIPEEMLFACYSLVRLAAWWNSPQLRGFQCAHHLACSSAILFLSGAGCSRGNIMVREGKVVGAWTRFFRD